MKVTMSSDEKQSTAEPTFVITAPTQAAEPMKSSKLTKKNILIGVICLVIAVLVLIAVLVGIKLVKDSDTAMLKYSLSMKDSKNNDVQQNVSVDANVVVYHVVKEGQDVWIVDDFDKNVQVMKVTAADSTVACYVTALNRSEATDPKSIPSSAPTTNDKTPSKQLVYIVDDNPISDISFLGKRVTNLCQNIPTYWLKPHCNDGTTGNMTTSGSDSGRTKRSTYVGTCTDAWGTQPCYCGCCNVMCGSFASSTFYYSFYDGYYHCTYLMYHVCWNFGLAPYYCYYNGVNCYYP